MTAGGKSEDASQPNDSELASVVSQQHSDDPLPNFGYCSVKMLLLNGSK